MRKTGCQAQKWSLCQKMTRARRLLVPTERGARAIADMSGIVAWSERDRTLVRSRCAIAFAGAIVPHAERARSLRFTLVPEIQPMELVVGFASCQHAMLTCLQHLAQAFRAIATRQQHQHTQQLRPERRHVGVIMIETDTKVRVLQRRIER